MASRPVFQVFKNSPYYVQVNIEYDHTGGQAVDKKQKNITAIHEAYERLHQGRVLEISTKSMQENGPELSAFNLKRSVEGLDEPVPIECIFQASKVFRDGGPYTDLMEGTAKKAKTDPRLKSSGPLTGFHFEGRDYPTEPVNAFYNYIYITALMEEANSELSGTLNQYQAFTDIEFNPKSSLNCQACAAAIYVSLLRENKLRECRTFEGFVRTVYGDLKEAEGINLAYDKVQKEHADDFLVGDVITHQCRKDETADSPETAGQEEDGSFGTGKVTKVEGGILTVDFDRAGVKRLAADFVRENCIVEKCARPVEEETQEEITEGMSEAAPEGGESAGEEAGEPIG